MRARVLVTRRVVYLVTFLIIHTAAARAAVYSLSLRGDMASADIIRLVTDRPGILLRHDTPRDQFVFGQRNGDAVSARQRTTVG